MFLKVITLIDVAEFLLPSHVTASLESPIEMIVFQGTFSKRASV